MLKNKLSVDCSSELHEELEAELAKTLQEEIDAEVMRELLKDVGWHEVTLQWIMTHEQSQEVDEWVSRKTKGKHWTRGLVWLFENDTDAMWFRMRWMSA